MFNKLNNYFIIYLTILPLVGIITLTYFHFPATNLAGAIALLLFKTLLATNKNIKIEKYYFFYILFFIYQTLIDSLKVPNYSFTFKQFYLNPYLVPIFVFLVIENTYINEKTYNRLIKILKVVIIIAAIVILYQATINSNFLVFKVYKEVWYSLGESIPRFPSIYSWISPHYSMGFIFVPTLALVIGDKLWKNEKYVLVWYIIGLIVAFLSLFRWTMINMLVLAFMYLLARKVNLSQIIKLVFYTVLIFISAYIILTVFKININEFIVERILQKGKIQENSGYTRILAFKFFFEFFPQNPIFGHGDYLGYNLITMINGRSSQIHVGFLSLLYYWGIIGGVLYSLFLYYFFKRIFSISKLSKNWGPFFGWSGFILANLTLVYLGPNQSGLYLCLVVVKYLENKIIIELKEKPHIFANKFFALKQKILPT